MAVEQGVSQRAVGTTQTLLECRGGRTGGGELGCSMQQPRREAKKQW